MCWKAPSIHNNTNILRKVQRTVSISITGALRTTPSKALSVILDIPPIDLMAKEVAAKSAMRLKATGQWIEKDYGHSTILKEFPCLKGLKCDYTTPIANFDRKF